MTRKRFSERWVIQTLLFQGAQIPCYRCKILFTPDDDMEREHIAELALGGADEPHNCAYSHEACHAKITNGTKATSAGSSKHKIAKLNRLTGKTKGRPKRKWAAGRKIPARPFQKRPKEG